MQNVAVVVHMQEQVLTGVVSLSSGRRLSDILNTNSIKQSDSSGTFLKLADVTIDSTDGIKERAEEIYINREAIEMIRTLEKDAARGSFSRDETAQILREAV